MRMRPIEARVLYEDNHLIAVCKESGELVQGDATGDTPLVERVREHIRVKYQKPGNVFTGLVHRIDRPVSGVVMLAKTSKGLERMNRIFKERAIQKTYWAIVEGTPERPEGMLQDWLVKDGSKNKSRVAKTSVRGGAEAKLHYRTLQHLDRYTLLEVKPITGRHHQIRVQLAAMGCPIKGDLKYGAKRSNRDGRIHLHARSLEFIHPIQQKPLQITAPVPEEDALWGAISVTPDA